MRIIILLLAIGVVLFFYYRVQRMLPEKRRQLIRVLLITGVAMLMAVLAFTGRLNWLIAAVAALLPMLPRLTRFLLGAWPTILPYVRRYQQNKQSSMQSRIIKLHIDMLTGEWVGEVLEGNYKGRALQQLSVSQLQQLLEYCQQHDQESSAMLSAYLDRMHPGWSAGSTQSSINESSMSDMTEKQARDILGVTETADKKAIIKAHKQLMQKLHPDRGGSDYLARQINKAKDRLIK